MLDWIASTVIVAAVALVAAKVALAPSPDAGRVATPAERAALADAIAKSESAWLVETEQAFPSDRWSQSDDFHGREYKAVVGKAREAGVRIEDVLRGIDDDIHQSAAPAAGARPLPDPRSARAVPCKPRPIYD